MLARINGDVNIDQQGNVGISPSVQGAFDTARKGVQADYAQAGRGQQAQIAQQLKTQGNPYSTEQASDLKLNAAHNLDVSRSRALNNLDFQEAESGLGQFNSLMNLLGAGTGTALNLGGGFAAQQGQAIGMLSNQSQGGGALTGAMGGAAAGSAAGPYGALIGAVIGGAGGYFAAG